MLDAGRREEGRMNNIHRWGWNDDFPGIHNENVRYRYMRAAAHAGIGRWTIVIPVRRLRRDVALVRVKQITRNDLPDNKRQHAYRRYADRLGKEPHHDNGATKTIPRQKSMLST